MRNNDTRKSLILTGVLSVIAFALVIVLCFQHGIFGGAGGDEPVSAHTDDRHKENDDPAELSADNDTDKPLDSDMTSSESEAAKNFTFADGFSINGVDVSGKSLAEIKELVTEAETPDPKDKVKLSFEVDGEKISGQSEHALNFSNNLSELIEAAKKASESGNGEKQYVSEWTTDRSNISEIVHDVLDSYVKEPVEAYASGFDTDNLKFIIEESQPGVSIDFDAIIDSVKESLDAGNYELDIPVETTVIEPKTTAEFLQGYLCKVSSTTSTTTSSSNRNTNIRLVCEKLNGLVLQPGEQFDFNKYIGERTEAAGYKEAGGIFNGALRQELGGGICQANAMIFHSVVKADLQVDTRTPHTWPSDYVEIGTDATVSWGGPEFRFTNNSEYPIALHAYYGNQKVTVEVYGRPLPDGMTIKLKGEETSRTEAKVEYIADSDMELDSRVTEKSGHDAIKAKAYKIYYDADGKEIKREEAFYSSYPMINKVVRVGTKAEDGTIFKLDKETGETIAPKGYVSPTPTPDPDDPENGTDTEDPKPTKKPKKDKDKDKNKNGENPTSTPVEDNEDNGEQGNENTEKSDELIETPTPTAEPTPEPTPEPEEDPVPVNQPEEGGDDDDMVEAQG